MKTIKTTTKLGYTHTLDIIFHTVNCICVTSIMKLNLDTSKTNVCKEEALLCIFKGNLGLG